MLSKLFPRQHLCSFLPRIHLTRISVQMSPGNIHHRVGIVWRYLHGDYLKHVVSYNFLLYITTTQLIVCFEHYCCQAASCTVKQQHDVAQE